MAAAAYWLALGTIVTAGVVVGWLHLEAWVKPIFTARGDEPLGYWVYICAGPLSTLPAVGLALFNRIAAAWWLLAGAFVSWAGGTLAASFDQGRFVVLPIETYKYYTIPMLALGASLFLAGRLARSSISPSGPVKLDLSTLWNVAQVGFCAWCWLYLLLFSVGWRPFWFTPGLMFAALASLAVLATRIILSRRWKAAIPGTAGALILIALGPATLFVLPFFIPYLALGLLALSVSALVASLLMTMAPESKLGRAGAVTSR